MPDNGSEFPSLSQGTVTLPFAAELDVQECLSRLARSSVGRVVYTDGALPAITPVRYALDGWQVFFRPPLEPRLVKALTGAVVAFEVDQLGDELQDGWSVVVTGVAELCSVPSQWPRVAKLNLAGPRDAFDHVFALSPGIITGRCIPAL